MIAKKLDSLNKFGGGSRPPIETYKLPSFEEQVGQAAKQYLEKMKENKEERDPLFPDRNTY